MHVWLVLCAMHCPKLFTGIFSVNSYNIFMEIITINYKPCVFSFWKELKYIYIYIYIIHIIHICIHI